MNEIVKCGLVIGMLLCAATGAASAADVAVDEYSEDYKMGFFDAAVIIGQATWMAGNLEDLYIALGGQSTAETAELVSYYNNRTANFNQQVVPSVNSVIEQVFGPDDNRTEQLSLMELPYIS